MANNIVILVRGDTAANWEKVNPILKLREMGYDMTNRRFKVGDGTTAWKDLPYTKPDVINDLITGGVDAALSAEQGKKLKTLVDGKADSSDLTTLQQNISNLEQKISQIVEGGSVKVIDALAATNSSTDALSAKQGWVLRDLTNRARSLPPL